MNKLITLALTVFVSAQAFAAEVDCSRAAEKGALKAARIAWGMDNAETASVVGSKILFKGPFLQTFVVGLSDEVEPSDWIVVLDPQARCKVKFAGAADEGSSIF
jgi:hypothetical protein